MRYVTFDESGNLSGCYLQDLRPEHAQNYIEVTPQQAAEWTKYKHEDGALVEIVAQPAIVVPEAITPRQGMLILSRYGLLTTVQTMLDGMSGQEGVEARIDFERANEWKREWPLLNAMAGATGLTSAQVDQMFIEGSQL